MNENKVMEIKVGITILLATVLLVMSIVWLKGITFKPNTFEVEITFNNTAGLQIGDPVTVSGMKVGKVTDINLEADSVLVSVSLSNSVILKEDVRAVITSTDFFGGKKIELVTGVADNVFKSKRFRGTREPDITELTSQLKEIATDVKGTLQRVDSVLIGVNNFVGDKKMINSLKNAVYNLDSTTSRVRQIVERSDVRIDSTLSRLSSSTKIFKTMLSRTDAQIDSTFGNVRLITQSVMDVTQSLDSIVSKVQSGEGNLGRMIYDDQLYWRINRTTQQLDSLVGSLREKGVKVNVKLFGD